MTKLSEAVEKIFEKNRIIPQKIVRLSGRFLAIRCLHRGRPSIFKIVIAQNIFERNDSNRALAKEADFLNFVQKKGGSLLKKSVSKIYLSQKSRNSWYLKDFLTGQPCSLASSHWFFKPAFFNDTTAVAAKNFYLSLYSLSEKIDQRLSVKLNRSILKNNEKYVMDWQNLVSFYSFNHLPIKKEYALIKKFLLKSRKLYDSQQNVLNHFEPYPDHLILEKDNLKIIDWENVGFSDTAHDPAVIWLRAFEHQAWQKKFITPFLSLPNFKKLFNLEVVIQSITNMRYFLDPLSFYDRQKSSQMVKKLYQYLKQGLHDQLL